MSKDKVAVDCRRLAIELARRDDRLYYRRLPHAEGLPLPAYESEHAAGLDLVAAVPAVKALFWARAPGVDPTGFAIELPRGSRLRSGHARGWRLKEGVTVLNSPGTIDADYRGEIGVMLINFGTKPFAVRRGARIAQLVVSSVERVALIASERLTSSSAAPMDSVPPGSHPRR